MINPGFQVNTAFERPDSALVSQFKGLASSNISDAMNRSFCMASRIRPYNTAPLYGPAFTVKVKPGDNLMLHKATELAQPGDVIVVDGQGDMECSIVGDLVLSLFRKRGIRGIILDGCVRDVASYADWHDFAVFAAGINPHGPLKEGPGEIGFPIACGNAVVMPGDIVVGDEDGVVVVRQQNAADVLKKTHAVMAKEKGVVEEIAKGDWSRPWLDEILEKNGCGFL